MTDGDLVYGMYAGLAALEHRALEVRRVACSPILRRQVDAVLRAAGNPLEPSVLGDDELAGLAASKHHEGLVVALGPRRWVPAAELAKTLWERGGTALALDRVRNPYNVGAILRTAAFFGIDAVLLGAPAPHPALHPDAVRVAEGGAEHLLLTRTTDLAETLRRLREARIEVVGADGRGAVDALGFAYRRPTVLVLGHEREGLGERVRAQCETTLAVTGSGRIDSLNVSVAAGVLVATLIAGPAHPR